MYNILLLGKTKNYVHGCNIKYIGLRFSRKDYGFTMDSSIICRFYSGLSSTICDK